MRNKNKKVRLLVFLALIVLLSGCGGSLAAKTGTTPISFEKASRPTTSSVPGLRLTGSSTVGPTSTPTPTPEATATTPTPTSTVAPLFTSGGRFTTLPPGSALPSDAECAARVRYSSWEPRPDNTAANHTNVYAQGYRLTGSYLAQYGYQQRVTGNFAGTTDEIIQWGACKWGIDEDIVRAQAVQESHWRQSMLGDCNGGKANGCDSIGILQVKGANDPPTHPGTWPYASQSTVFDVDYTLAVWRNCFEGNENWLGNGYHAGDEWGCVGRWFSGDWYGGSLGYIANVKNFEANKAWLQAGF